MKRYAFLSFMLIALMMLSGCGHNILTDYEVNGFDLSVPIFGYPFGIRIGCVKVNANMVRGNTSYSSHSGNSAGISGNAQKTSVIQFSSNTQINEGNVEKILGDNKIADDVKKSFVKDYLAKKEAPELLPVSSKTPFTSTVSSKGTRIHEAEFAEQKSLFDGFSLNKILSNTLASIGDYFLLTQSGQIIMFLLRVIMGIMTGIFTILVIRKVWKIIKNLFVKIFKKKADK